MNLPRESTAARCLQFTSLFEAEALVQLMLDRWGHPLASDQKYARELVEDAGEIPRQSVDGERLLEDVEPEHVSFITAVWYVEWNTVSNDSGIEGAQARKSWLDQVRHTFPSCFCNPTDLA